MKKVYCINCDGMVDYVVMESTKTFEVRNVQVEATVKEARCKQCGELLYVREIEIENDISIYDAYKKKVGLLTSKEIIAIRKKRGMSQRQLARFLNIGEKDITRYENGAIQTRSIDQFIKAIGDDICYLFLRRAWNLEYEEETPKVWVIPSNYLAKGGYVNCSKKNYEEKLYITGKGGNYGRRNQVYAGELLG